MAQLGSSQFRESAIVRNTNPEPLDDRAELTAPREWAVLAGLGLALAALVIWGAVGSVERTLRADGVLAVPGDRRAIPAAVAGTVIDVSVEEGERVAAGQAILRIAPAGLGGLAGSSAASVGAPDDDDEAVRASAALPADPAALRAPVVVPSPGDGTIAALLVAPGDSVAPGRPVAELVSGGGGPLDAVAFVPREAAWPLAPGMAARVSVETPEGRRSLAAEVVAVAPRATGPPGWLARLHPGAATRGRGHVVRLAMSDPAARGSGRGLEDGTPGRIEIVLERTSPFALLVRR